ncbi:MAG: hypothetical protein ACLSHE_13425 [Roseburia sp.]
MELSTQAKSLYKEFPNLSESDIRSIDNKIKKKIDTMSNTKEYMEISKFIQDEVSNLYKNKQSINAKKIKKKANRLALMYIENSRVFSLQESWYALLAFFIAIANMIQRIVDAKLTGELISSKNIGSRPLYGTYATDNNADFKHDIEQWAIENGIDIEWTATPSLLKDIYYNLVHNGVGNVILTAFLLFISSMIAWFVLRAKGRSIRLLGGVELNKIYKEDTLAISKLFIPSYITALFIFLPTMQYYLSFAMVNLLLKEKEYLLKYV